MIGKGFYMQKTNFDYKTFFSAVFSLALPIALQNLLSTTAGMVDTIMIGSAGELAVAAVGICSQISSLFFSCYFGFAGGAILFFAQYWGAKDYKGINRTFGICASIITLIAIVFGSVCVLKPELMLSIYTDKQNIIEMGIPYIRIIGFSYPVTVIVLVINFFFRATERVKVPFICSVVGLCVNFVLNWLLIYGRFGLPKMGPAGAAIGTLASGLVNLGLLLICLVKDQADIRLHFNQMLAWGNGFVPVYIKKCFPIICNELLYGIGQMVINIVIGHQSESAIAAMAAFRVLEGFVFAFFGGLADAAAVVVGKNVGSGEHELGYRNAVGYSILCPAITFVLVGIMLIFNQQLYGLFGLGAEAMQYGKYMLMIYLFAGTIRTCNYIMNCCYRSGGDPVFGTVLEVSCLFIVSVPATWIAGMTLGLPFLAVFAFVYTDEIFRLICEIWYTRRCKWIKPVTEEGKATLAEFMESRKKHLHGK